MSTTAVAVILVVQGGSAAAGGAGANGPQMSLDKHQLARLHGVLGPFMLRRIKADVVAEMVPKTEVSMQHRHDG